MRRIALRAGALIGAAVVAFALSNGCGTPPETDCGTGFCVCENGSCKCRDNIERCDRECRADCDLLCNEDHPCDLSCGFDCKVTCSSTASCDVTVGSGSTVTCNGPGKCNVTCKSSCRVYRPTGVGGIFTCQSSQISDCSDGSKACGGC